VGGDTLDVGAALVGVVVAVVWFVAEDRLLVCKAASLFAFSTARTIDCIIGSGSASRGSDWWWPWRGWLCLADSCDAVLCSNNSLHLIMCSPSASIDLSVLGARD